MGHIYTSYIEPKRPWKYISLLPFAPKRKGESVARCRLSVCYKEFIKLGNPEAKAPGNPEAPKNLGNTPPTSTHFRSNSRKYFWDPVRLVCKQSHVHTRGQTSSIHTPEKSSFWCIEVCVCVCVLIFATAKRPFCHHFFVEKGSSQFIVSRFSRFPPVLEMPPAVSPPFLLFQPARWKRWGGSNLHTHHGSMGTKYIYLHPWSLTWNLKTGGLGPCFPFSKETFSASMRRPFKNPLFTAPMYIQSDISIESQIEFDTSNKIHLLGFTYPLLIVRSLLFYHFFLARRNARLLWLVDVQQKHMF